MKCIKERCDYYSDHDFNVSWFVCDACSLKPSRRKKAEVECLIGYEIANCEENLKLLKELKEEVEKNQ